MMTSITPQPIHVHIHLDSKAPVEPPANPTLWDKAKMVFGVALAVFGFFMIATAASALIGHLAGVAVIQAESNHALFMTGLMSAIGGLHLAKGSASPTSAEITAGPFSYTV